MSVFRVVAKLFKGLVWVGKGLYRGRSGSWMVKVATTPLSVLNKHARKL